MTKKDYIAMADVFRRGLNIARTLGGKEEAVVLSIVRDYERLAMMDNPRFNVEKFRKAVGFAKQ